MSMKPITTYFGIPMIEFLIAPMPASAGDSLIYPFVGSGLVEADHAQAQRILEAAQPDSNALEGGDNVSLVNQAVISILCQCSQYKNK